MSLSGDIRDGHLRIGEWSAERQPGTGGVHPYGWGVKLSSGPLVRGVVVHDREDGTLGLVIKVLAAAVRQFGGRDHPDATAETVAEALAQYESGGVCHFGRTCGLCDCGRADETPEQTQTRDAMELDRARAVLALIPPQRCAPTEDEVAAAIEGADWPEQPGESRSLDTPGSYRRRARAVAKLYGDQPTVAQVKAEALREAADAWYDDDSGGHWDDWPIVNGAPLLCRNSEEGRDWLRARADQIESGAEHG